MNTFGKRLRAAITAAGVTQEQLGEHVGRSKGAVTHWVQDTSEPDLTTLARICDLLKVSADFLVRGVDAQYLDAQTSEIAERVQSLGKAEREGLHRLIFGNSATDDVVERKMPITRKLLTQPKK